MITLFIPETVIPIDDSKFREICVRNPDNRVERTKMGEIIIISPTGGETGNWNAELTGIFRNWNKKHKLGRIFDSSTAFRLPSSAIRSPDTAFISNLKWETLTPKEKSDFPPVCPDFVAEIRSKSHSLKDLQNKMKEWIENGCRLAWLLDISERKVYIYRPEKEMEILEGENIVLNGENILPELEFYFHELYM